MAIALRAKNGANTGASGTLAVPVPTGTVSGDVLLIGIVVSGTTLPGTPTGLTLITSATGGPSVGIYRRVCNGTEPASYSFTVASGASATSRSYSGVDNTTPINVNGTPNRTATSATCTALSITTTVANCELVWFGFTATNAGASFTDPTGFANQQYQHQTSGTTTSTASDDKAQASAGASGNAAATFGGSANNYGVMVALQPAASGVANTLTASPGAMTITGSASKLPVAHQPTMSPGSMVVTGAATKLPVAHKPTMSPGAMAITGSAATLPVKRLLTINPASIAITGAAAKLPVGHQTSTSPGVIVINGAPATLQPSSGVHYTLTVSPGSLAITGSQTLLPVKKAVALSPATVTVTGDLAKLPVKYALVAAPRSIIITGFSTGAKPAAPAGADDDMWYFWANSLRQARVQAQPNVAKEPLAWWSVSIDVGEDDQLLELLALGLL